MVELVIYFINYISRRRERSYMSDEEPSISEEVLTSAKDQLDDETISLADNEEILHALSELTPVYENDQSYFVLGNYDREPIRRLNLVVDRLNCRQNA